MSENTTTVTYASAGVDVEAGDRAVELMKGDFAEFPVPEPFDTKFKKKAKKFREKKEKEWENE